MMCKTEIIGYCLVNKGALFVAWKKKMNIESHLECFLDGFLFFQFFLVDQTRRNIRGNARGQVFGKGSQDLYEARLAGGDSIFY